MVGTSAAPGHSSSGLVGSAGVFGPAGKTDACCPGLSRLEQQAIRSGLGSAVIEKAPRPRRTLRRHGCRILSPVNGMRSAPGDVIRSDDMAACCLRPVASVTGVSIPNSDDLAVCAPSGECGITTRATFFEFALRRSARSDTGPRTTAWSAKVPIRPARRPSG